MRAEPRLIAVTMGDPAGIGPEVVAASLARPVEGAHAFVIGDVQAMERAIALLKLPCRVRAIAVAEEARAQSGEIDVLPCGALPEEIGYGRIDARAGQASFDYVSRAIDLALAGRVAAIVTAPINKEAWDAAGVTQPGHTEVLAERCGVDDFAMMLSNDELRVVLVSIHVPLAEAVRLVTTERELRIIALPTRQCGRWGSNGRAWRSQASIRMRVRAACSGARTRT